MEEFYGQHGSKIIVLAEQPEARAVWDLHTVKQQGLKSISLIASGTIPRIFFDAGKD